jgi:hypothetical protein
VDANVENVLRDLFPPLAGHEAEILRRMIEAGEVVPRVVVWKGTGVVVDGREAKRVCDELGMTCEVEERDFADLDDVVRWRIETQLGRRNLTPLAASYYRGKLYLSLKRQGRRPEEIVRQTGEIRTDKLLARQFGVGARTISRDADLATALDEISEQAGDEPVGGLFPDGFVLRTVYRGSILSGRIRPTRGQVLELTRMRKDEMTRAMKGHLAGEKKPRRKEGPAAEAPMSHVNGQPPHPTRAYAVSCLEGVPVPDPDATQDPRGDSHGTKPTNPPVVSACVSVGVAEEDCTAERRLAEINRLWNGLDRATQMAFLLQDPVAKRIAAAGFVRLDRPAGERRTA